MCFSLIVLPFSPPLPVFNLWQLLRSHTWDFHDQKHLCASLSQMAKENSKNCHRATKPGWARVKRAACHKLHDTAVGGRQAGEGLLLGEGLRACREQQCKKNVQLSPEKLRWIIPALQHNICQQRAHQNGTVPRIKDKLLEILIYVRINRLRAVNYTQNQSNHLCIPPFTMAESRVHPFLLIVAPEHGAGKAASVTFADAVAEGSDPSLHSPCSEPRKKRSCLHHSILSYPTQADGGQAPPVSSHSPVHSGCEKQGLHNPSRELHCNTATSQSLLGPHLGAANTVLDFTATSAEKGITSEFEQMQEHHSFACASSKIKFRTDCLPLSAGKEKISRGLSSTD